MPSPSRRYGGLTAADRVAERRTRLLEAGLELMGTRGTAGTTVRGVAEHSGLAARYVYESFPTVDDLVVAVFDAIAAEALTRALEAFASAPEREEEQTRAVLGAMVDLVLDDPRKGRVLLLEAPASPQLAARMTTEIKRFAGLLAATASSGSPLGELDGVPPEVHVVARFMTGGFAHSLAAVLSGDLPVGRDRLVDALVGLFGAVSRGYRAELNARRSR